MIDKTRELIKDNYYVIENVEFAKNKLINPIRLCGEMFNLKVIRHRLFEINLPIKEPEHEKHSGRVIYRSEDRNKNNYKYFGIHGNNVGTLQEWREAMGIDWMEKEELTQAILPAYTEYIGKEIKRLLDMNFY